MHLTPMRYKNFTWPHNPESYSVTWKRRLAVQQVPFGGCSMQEIGESYRVMRGEGTFTGDGAYDTFGKLAEVFNRGGAGLLIHPVWKATEAFFVALQLVEEPLPDYVRYSFEFWEDCGGETSLRLVSAGHTPGAENGASGNGNHAPEARDDYIVKKGDTLWGIAKRFGVTLNALIAANPQIKNPNLIYSGNRVHMP